MMPWWYRWRFPNWLIAQPWRWHYRALYRAHRVDSVNPFNGRVLYRGVGPLRAAWRALTFPHVHHESEL